MKCRNCTRPIEPDLTDGWVHSEDGVAGCGWPFEDEELYARPMFLAPESLIDRHVYYVRSRNLVIGAWNAATKGFIGIREKFSTRYLFTEYERDLAGPPHGTARAIEDLGVVVPSRITMVEHLKTDEGWRENDDLYRLLEEHEGRAYELQRADDLRRREYAQHDRSNP